MFRKLLVFMLFVLVVALLAAALLWRDYRQFESASMFDQGTVRLWLPAGGNLASAVHDLERLGVARMDWRWRVLARLYPAQVGAGEYLLESGATPTAFLDQLVAGRVLRHRFTIIEGWNVDELRAMLAQDSRIVSVTDGLESSTVMDRLDCPGCYAEGRFLPETYLFERGDSDLDLLRRAHSAMKAALDEAWEGRDPGLPIETPDELLVLASLIEKETRVAAERDRVAGVFVRRLQRGMRLQTDPTVLYGVEAPADGRIRRVHLTTDHPWNTYTRHGLPPTPIALPGKGSLLAAAQPADGNALYFVARGDGSHQFSATLAEHNRAVDRYIRGRN